jgi:hypothetical protein
MSTLTQYWQRLLPRAPARRQRSLSGLIEIAATPDGRVPMAAAATYASSRANKAHHRPTEARAMAALQRLAWAADGSGKRPPHPSAVCPHSLASKAGSDHQST